MSLHMFQGTVNPTYQPIPPGTGPAVPVTPQPGSVPGHNMAQIVAPTPPRQGFMPVNAGMVQRPVMGSMQPPSPTQAAAAAQPTLTPAAPPPTVQTVDTSNVPGNYFIYLYICHVYVLYLFFIGVL